MNDAKLMDEQGRLAALQRYNVLDTMPEPSFDRITQLVQSVLNVPMSAVSLIDQDRQWFKSRQGIGDSETSRGVSFCTHTIQQRETMNVGDALTDVRFAENPLVVGPPHIRSYLGAPLSTPDGYNVGSLCAIDTVPRVFDASQLAMLSTLASMIVDELELRVIAQSDGLTGAMTRRGFLIEGDKALARLRSDAVPCAMILLDADHFKSINDTYGHPMGDLVLKAIAKHCRDLVPAGCMVGRLGGEEFAILLTGDAAAADNALAFAETVRAGLERLQMGTLPQAVTASFGVALGDPLTASCEAWLATADVALYAAKRTGRNRCVLADGV
ncbi:sensor domain-containing diguanylate cyclase [Phenylobacterium immobile]|uniref:sensor domain-containing diguanylate cyclase n=1 Tax=Phenylobacterium immobile TaxID=21 RepID=UPI000A8FA9F9|nr:sensor domain-containing diguanylate cyclase [Phenylobacterium immobile]